MSPFTQMAGIAAMRDELGYRDAKMNEFRKKVELLVEGMNRIEGVLSVALIFQYSDDSPVKPEA